LAVKHFEAKKTKFRKKTIMNPLNLVPFFLMAQNRQAAKIGQTEGFSTSKINAIQVLT
jgi:hypothetical protein